MLRKKKKNIRGNTYVMLVHHNMTNVVEVVNGVNVVDALNVEMVGSMI